MTPISVPDQPISCLQTAEILSLWRDEMASAQDLKALETHLLTCLSCQRARPQFIQLFARLDQMFDRHNQS